jgi:hypothetical protein
LVGGEGIGRRGSLRAASDEDIGRKQDGLHFQQANPGCLGDLGGTRVCIEQGANVGARRAITSIPHVRILIGGHDHLGLHVAVILVRIPHELAVVAEIPDAISIRVFPAFGADSLQNPAG